MHRGFSFVAILAVAMHCSYGQYPQQPYPPQQYPPQQYPPQQTPQDPGVVYPPTLPGGMRLPPIPWPKRKPKEGDEKKESKGRKDRDENLISMDGTLRELGAKHLLLGAGREVFRFRLLPRTRFEDKGAEPIRDSLLKPGDFLSVQATKDDAETAVRITLLREGSPAEKAEAARPVEAARVRAPEASDFGAGPAPLPNEAERGEKPVPASGPARDETAAPRSASEATSLPPALQVLADARLAASTFGANLPNFVAEQAVVRSQSTTDPPSWRAADVVTSEVTVLRGKEQYSNVRVNGRVADQPPSNSGLWSTGEFFTSLEELFDPATQTQFAKERDGRAAGRPAHVYSYKVDSENSDWELVAPNGQRYRTAHRGEVWIDKESRRVLRIEQRAEGVPPTFGIGRAETRIDYAYVKIDGGTYLLPAESEAMGCQAGTSMCSRNVITFRNYRKFETDSKVIY